MNRITPEQQALAIKCGDLKPFNKAKAGCSDCGLHKLFAEFGLPITEQMDSACDWHDEVYHLGNASGMTRKECDAEFRTKIIENITPVLMHLWITPQRHRQPFLLFDDPHELADHIAKTYFNSVRFGGASWLPTPFGWGFGWRWSIRVRGGNTPNYLRHI